MLAAALAVAGSRGDPAASQTVVRGPRVDTGPTIAAAGDIACDPDARVAAHECRQHSTSNLLVGAGYDAVLPLGDLQYEDGDYSRFRASYDRSWGRVKAISRPVPGNHEYRTEDGSGYYRYFGRAAGTPGKGYYSYDLGGWHLVALNSSCSEIGGCGKGSPQERWLRSDLAAHPAACTLAYWHHPRFSSGDHGSDPRYEALWRALVDAGADLVLVGHDHDYERFAPQAADETLDRAHGIREFVVGTGGRSLRPFPTVAPNSELRESSTFGVLELRLGEGAYAWRFRPALGFFTDRGSASCH